MLINVRVTILCALTAVFELVLRVLTTTTSNETLYVLLRDLALMTTDSCVVAYLRRHLIFSLYEHFFRSRPLIVPVEIMLWLRFLLVLLRVLPLARQHCV